jgi:hypothetical protein
MIDTSFPVLALPKTVPLIAKNGDWHHGYESSDIDSRSSSPRAHGHSSQQINRALQEDFLDQQHQETVSREALQASGKLGHTSHSCWKFSALQASTSTLPLLVSASCEKCCVHHSLNLHDTIQFAPCC